MILKVKILRFFQSVWIALTFFIISYYWIYIAVAERNIQIATFNNMLMTIYLVAFDKIEYFIYSKIKAKYGSKPKNIYYRSLIWWIDGFWEGFSIKTGLYFFYIILILCRAALVAGMNIPVLHALGNYFETVDYGILVLIAADKFFEQLFRDTKAHQERGSVMKQWMDKHMKQKPGVVKDFQEDWQAHRWLVGDKMFAMYGGDRNDVKILTLKLKPENGEILREQYPDMVVPGYYMNKVHWNSFYLDEDVPEELIRKCMDESYELIFGGLTKKKQAEILE